MNPQLSRMLQGPMRGLVVSALAVSFAATSAFAAEYPKRKSGLWELKVSSARLPGGSTLVQTCVDEKTDNALAPDDEMTEQTCSQYDTRRVGDRLLIDAVCKADEMTVTSHMVVTGRFDSAYRAEIKSTYDPPVEGEKENTMVIEARWLGPCQPGQKPGDVVLPQLPSRPSGRR